MFPIWDVLFKTYIVPEDNRDVKFGIHERDAKDLDGVLKLYWVPFRDAFRLVWPRKRTVMAEQGKEDAGPIDGQDN